MAYQSLYRRYRPHRFGEVRGQPRLVEALRNAVREDRVGHAYLFSGPRGTGKTTTARILAKALNCDDLRDGEPCCECTSCLAIDAGTSFDLHELDAASNRGINEIRDLLATIALGSAGRTKVYILDEVHMLTKEASGALLKTLEEPPPHVVFVLATTDPQKVLPTIRSRTQHFHVHLLPATDLRELVEDVIADAGLEVDEAGIDHALRAGAGSARDTLSALETVVAAGGTIEVEHHVEAVVAALAANDPGAVLLAVAQSIEEGREPRLVGEELIAELRNAFLVSMGAGLAHAPDADVARAKHLAKSIVPATLTRALEGIGEALVEMRQAADPRIPLEVTLVRLCRVDADTSPAALLERIERLEDRLRGAAPAGPAAAPAPAGADGGRPADRAREVLARQRSAATPEASPPDEPEPAADEAPAPSAPGGAERPAGRAALGAHRNRRGARGDVSADEPAPASSSPAAPPAEEAPAATPAAATGDGPPSRDELTLAWADSILTSLRPGAKARFAAGRFLDGIDGSAVLALPNPPHLKRCEEMRGDVEEALAAHFGRPVPLRLVVDDGSGRVLDDAPAAPAPDDGGDGAPEAIDEVGPLEDLVDAGAGDLLLERIEQHFPGAEEVVPSDAES